MNDKIYQYQINQYIAMWTIECKGFYAQNDKFTAIVPIWSKHSEAYRLYPANHIKITGIGIRNIDFDSEYNRLADWHPDNPFSQQKWIEINLRWCKWKWNQRREYMLSESHDIGYPTLYEGRQYKRYRYFVPAIQLQPLNEYSEVVYKSNDRKKSEFGDCNLPVML